MERDTDGASTTDEGEVRPPAPGAEGGTDDPVDEMVEESFPASDPPSGWAGEDPRDLPAPTG